MTSSLDYSFTNDTDFEKQMRANLVVLEETFKNHCKKLEDEIEEVRNTSCSIRIYRRYSKLIDYLISWIPVREKIVYIDRNEPLSAYLTELEKTVPFSLKRELMAMTENTEEKAKEASKILFGKHEQINEPNFVATFVATSLLPKSGILKQVDRDPEEYGYEYKVGYDIRGDVPIPTQVVSPWYNTSASPNLCNTSQHDKPYTEKYTYTDEPAQDLNEVIELGPMDHEAMNEARNEAMKQ
jgi:hypothetical protein